MAGGLAALVSEVEGVLGDPYVYGASGPANFDCSGLVQWAATKAGFKGVPRTSEAQWAWVDKIQASQLQPGDLVFSQWPGDNAAPGHVQIYVGGGNVVGADTVNVEKTTLAAQQGHIVGYGRIPGAKAGSGGTGGSGGGGGIGGGLLSLALPQDVLDMMTGAEKLVQGLSWFVNPQNWARITAAFLGLFLGAFGIMALVKAGT